MRFMKANLTIHLLATFYKFIIPELQWRETTLSDALKKTEARG